MRTRVLFGAASVLAMVGMLWASVTPVQACSCASGTELAERIQFIFEIYDLIILGAVAASDSERMQIDVETVYDGQAERVITLDQPADPGYSGDISDVEALGGDCSYTVLGGPGERYLLALQQEADGSYTAEGCASWSMRLIDADVLLSRYFEAVTTAANEGVAPLPPQEESDAASFPWLPAAIAAVAGPLAFLAGAAFLWRRGGTHSGRG